MMVTFAETATYIWDIACERVISGIVHQFKCGEEKFHSGEINMKELHTQIKNSESELSKLRSELDNKRIALETMNERVMNKIDSELFQANQENYLLSGNINWSLLPKHMYLVGQYSKNILEARSQERRMSLRF